MNSLGGPILTWCLQGILLWQVGAGTVEDCKLVACTLDFENLWSRCNKMIQHVTQQATIIIYVDSTEGFFQCWWYWKFPVVIEGFEFFHTQATAGRPNRLLASCNTSNTAYSAYSNTLHSELLMLSPILRKAVYTLLQDCWFMMFHPPQWFWSDQNISSNLVQLVLGRLVADLKIQSKGNFFN